MSFKISISGAASKDKRVERAVGVCKKLVAAFTYSWKKKRDLAEAQIQCGVPQHKLCTESVTRWGSRQKMIARVLEQQKPISQVLAADKHTRHLVPHWQDIEVWESMNEALGPLVDFTDSLSGESYVTVSYVKPVLKLFRSQHLHVSEGDTPLTKEMKTKIMEYLDEKYADPDTDDMLDMATLVDPRFKMEYIKQDKVEAIKTRAVSEILDAGHFHTRASEVAGGLIKITETALLPVKIMETNYIISI